jgi:hypothetical protein
MTPTLKFRHLNPVGRACIIVVAVGTLAVAAVAFAASYNAIYRLVVMLGLYGDGINSVFPLLLDTGFIIAELAAIVCGIFRVSMSMRTAAGETVYPDDVHRGWPWLLMLGCGALTVGFNVLHAALIAQDRLTVFRCVVASIPPALMIVAFQVDIAIVKWVMRALGKPLDGSGAALLPYQARYSPWAVQRADAPGSVPAGGASAKIPISDMGIGGRSIEDSKADIVRAFLRSMPSDQFARATKSSVAKGLQRDAGVTVDETWCSRILSEVRAERNGSG